MTTLPASPATLPLVAILPPLTKLKVTYIRTAAGECTTTIIRAREPGRWMDHCPLCPARLCTLDQVGECVQGVPEEIPGDDAGDFSLVDWLARRHRR